MNQLTVDESRIRRIAFSILKEYGYAGAMDYARRMVIEAGAENSQTWKEVIDRIYRDTHPLVFSPEYIPFVINGTKTATTRMRPKLRTGDRFFITGDDHREHEFEIVGLDTDVVRDLCYRYYRQEGCTDPMELYATLKGIYPDITTRTVMTTHIFSEVEV